MARRQPVTFVSATGPEKNLGDALIRRQVVRWATVGAGPLVAYVGGASHDWERSLGLDDRFTVLRGKKSVATWLWRIITAPRGSRLFFEPGEVPLGAGNVRREIAFIVMTLSLKMRGGQVVRPPRAIRQSSRWPLALHRFACRLSTVVLWREARSHQTAGIGEVVPDIGFAEDIRHGLSAADRDLLVISLRGDRPAPSDTWFVHVRELIDSTGLRPVLVAQVTDDLDRAAEVSKTLDADLVPWTTGSLDDHESVLREIYDRARMTLSDRLHVLILAALSGAVPTELVDQPAWKVAANFETIGFTGVSLVSDGSDHTRETLALQADRGPELTRCVATAQTVLTTRWPALGHEPSSGHGVLG